MKRYALFIFSFFAMPIFCIAQDKIKQPDSYYYRSGIDAYGNEDYAASMDYFDKELEQNPKNGYAMIWQAYIYEKYERYGQAMSKVNDGIKLVPKKDKSFLSSGYSLRAKINAELEDTIKAIADYELAFKLSNSTDYIYNKCNLLHAQSRYSDIDVELKRLMEIDANNAVLWTYIGRNEHSKGNYELALEKYSYSLKLDPTYSSAYSFRASTYTKLNKYSEAIKDVISALVNEGGLKPFIQLYDLAENNMSLLAVQLKKQQLNDPNNSQWSYYLGLMYNHVYNYIESENSFREALRISEMQGNQNSSIYNNLGETLTELGKYDEAIDFFEKSLLEDSTNTRPLRGKAEVYYRESKYMASIEMLSKAITLRPSYEIQYADRARVYMYSGRNRNALDDINTAISLDDKDCEFYILRAEIYRRMGKMSDAERDYRFVIELETQNEPDNQNLKVLGYAYARINEILNCKSTICRYTAQNKTADDSYAIACLYSLINDSDDALLWLERAFELGYCNFTQINNENALDNIKDNIRFKELVKKYQLNTSSIAMRSDDYEYIESISEVPFIKDAGIYKVKCTINELPLYFYFDTGASDVTISSVEAQFMLKNEYLKSSDIKGTQYYGTASGDIAEGTVIILKKVKFGELELNNVKATVVHNQKAPLLLGQTVLSRLGKIEIDYERKVIKVSNRKKKYM